jgi:hypothetical protein
VGDRWPEFARVQFLGEGVDCIKGQPSVSVKNRIYTVENNERTWLGVPTKVIDFEYSFGVRQLESSKIGLANIYIS